MAACVDGIDVKVCAQARHERVPNTPMGARAMCEEKGLAVAAVIPHVDAHSARAGYTNRARVELLREFHRGFAASGESEILVKRVLHKPNPTNRLQ